MLDFVFFFLEAPKIIKQGDDLNENGKTPKDNISGYGKFNESALFLYVTRWVPTIFRKTDLYLFE